MPGILFPHSDSTQDHFKHEDDEDVEADNEPERLVVVGDVVQETFTVLGHGGFTSGFVVLLNGIHQVAMVAMMTPHDAPNTVPNASLNSDHIFKVM